MRQPSRAELLRDFAEDAQEKALRRFWKRDRTEGQTYEEWKDGLSEGERSDYLTPDEPSDWPFDMSPRDFR